MLNRNYYLVLALSSLVYHMGQISGKKDSEIYCVWINVGSRMPQIPRPFLSTIWGPEENHHPIFYWVCPPDPTSKPQLEHSYGIMDPLCSGLSNFAGLEAAFSKDQCKDSECADLNVWHAWCPRVDERYGSHWLFHRDGRMVKAMVSCM